MQAQPSEAAIVNKPALFARFALGGLGRALLADPNFAYRAALELGHPAPHEVLPAAHARALARRR